jgi:short subunit dehydrogenase-like uncharacterized protein
MQERDFDVILYGATGVTGRQTVRYFAQHAPPTVRWAVAGRNSDKLRALNSNTPWFTVESTNQGAIDDLVAQANVILSTAGPFALYSDRVVDGCVRLGTDYVDITGETVWVRSLIDRYHERAAAQGTRIIPFCGFDSVPSDLGVSQIVQRLGPTTSKVIALFEAKGGSPNGGTVATALVTYEQGGLAQTRDPFLLSPGRKRALQPIERDPTGAFYERELGVWLAPFFMSTIDTRVVRRTSSLLGLDIAYQEYVPFEGVLAPLKAVGLASVTNLLSGAMHISAFRKLVGKSAPSGTGPSDETMDGGYFKCRFQGWNAEGQTATATLSGPGDPANRITVKCVCESALALVCERDKLPARAGILTPASGFGGVLVKRLINCGISISTE